MIKLLSVTRKYPPSVGGMEKLCYDLFNSFEKNEEVDQKIVALGKSQKNLIWFLPYCTLYLIKNAKKWDVIFYGDSLLCGPAFFAKVFSPKTRAVVGTYGLDILYPNFLYQLYLKLFYRCFDKYICSSKNTEKMLHNRNILDTVVINCGVDICKFSDTQKNKEMFLKKYKLPQDAVILITVGRLTKRKGVEWFVRNVMPEFIERNIYYFVIGCGEEEQHIKAAISECGLNEKIKMLGKVSDERLNELYINSDIFIMPNIYVPNDPEGFGIVAIEASLAGLIVLASDVDGISDAIEDGKNGYLLRSKNKQDFILKIDDIVNNPQIYNEFAQSFSRYTVEKYSMDEISRQYIETFKGSL